MSVPVAPPQAAPGASDPAPESKTEASAPSQQLPIATDLSQIPSLSELRRSVASKRSQDPEPQSDPEPQTPEASAAPEAASKPAEAEPPATPTTPDPKPASPGEGEGEGQRKAGFSRRSGARELEQLGDDLKKANAAIIELRTENERLKTQVPAPDSADRQRIYEQAMAVRLPDDEFERLAEKRKRETIDGVLLSPEENRQLDRAIQVRDWSAPWYDDAEKKADGRYKARESKLLDEIASGLRATAHLEGVSVQAIMDAEGPAGIYAHYHSAGYDAGLKAARAELQPQIDDLTTRLADAEATATSDRYRPRTLPVGGGPTGSGGGAPVLDFNQHTGHDLLRAAHDARRRRRS